MPFYEYRCVACGHRFDARRAPEMRRDPLACPACGGAAETRYSPPTVDIQSFGKAIHGGTTTKTRRNPQRNVEREQLHAHRRAENDRAVARERAELAESRAAHDAGRERLERARAALLSDTAG